MNAVILVCKNLRLHLEKAQEAMHTNIPVIELDTSLHKEPEKMRERILSEIEKIPPRYDTVLAAMGFCGGSWRDVPVDRTVIIPKMDDCITMLLTTDDIPVPNRKVPGCMYLTDNRDEQMTIPGIRRSLIARCGEKKGEKVFRLYFKHYTHVGIVDTGIYDSYGTEYQELAEESAELIGGSIIHVPGSNRVLEKLVSGEWDSQFLVLEPGRTVSDGDFI
ncbi:MAG: DUF1638 domain-containing protein [Flexilinea sp.]|nr:DUF1638 domain-containing protein [Flexilinea sp.]